MGQVVQTATEPDSITIRMLKRSGVDDLGFGLRVEEDQYDDSDTRPTYDGMAVVGSLDTEETSFMFEQTKDWRIVQGQ